MQATLNLIGITHRNKEAGTSKLFQNKDITK